MKGILRGLLLAAVPLAALADAPEIRVSDVALFYRVYDAAAGMPSAAALQRDYIDAGTEGVREFVPDRIVSGEALARRIASNRALYENARTCAAALPDVRTRVQGALGKLVMLLPEAKLPPVTLLIGRGNSGGTTGPTGVLIGVEMVCEANWMQASIEDRLVHLIAHEYAHVQQPITQRGENPMDGRHTLLEVSLIEGVAELLAELTSGSISNAHLIRWTVGRESALEGQFRHQMRGTDLSKWLYKGPGTPQNPGDLGYWMGYRIAKRYLERAEDKARAIRELVDLKDPEAILKGSGF
jgi:hypothetical protein